VRGSDDNTVNRAVEVALHLLHDGRNARAAPCVARFDLPCGRAYDQPIPSAPLVPDRASRQHQTVTAARSSMPGAVVMSQSISGERGMKKMRGMVALCVALSVAAGSSALLAQKPTRSRKKARKAEQLDIAVLLKPSIRWRGSGCGDGDDGDVGIHHFIRSQDGTTYVPFTVQPRSHQAHVADRCGVCPRRPKGAAPPAARARTARTRTRTRQAPSIRGERLFRHRQPEGKLARAFQVKGGDYDVFIAVKTRAPSRRRTRTSTRPSPSPRRS